jgi:hypothetical protein
MSQNSAIPNPNTTAKYEGSYSEKTIENSCWMDMDQEAWRESKTHGGNHTTLGESVLIGKMCQTNMKQRVKKRKKREMSINEIKMKIELRNKMDVGNVGNDITCSQIFHCDTSKFDAALSQNPPISIFHSNEKSGKNFVHKSFIMFQPIKLGREGDE